MDESEFLPLDGAWSALMEDFSALPHACGKAAHTGEQMSVSDFDALFGRGWADETPHLGGGEGLAAAAGGNPDLSPQQAHAPAPHWTPPAHAQVNPHLLVGSGEARRLSDQQHLVLAKLQSASKQHRAAGGPTWEQQLRALLREARQPPARPPASGGASVAPTVWNAQGLAGASLLGGAPPLKRTAACAGVRPPHVAAPAAVAEAPADGAAAAEARARRQARQASRRAKAGQAGVPAAPAVLGLGLGLQPAPRTGEASSAPSTPSADAAAAAAAAAAASTVSSLTSRLEAVEKEQRSSALKLQFMNKQNSALQLQVESLGTRNAALEKENARLRGLWESAQVYLDQGAGI